MPTNMNEFQQASQAAQTISQWSDRALFLLMLIVVLWGAYKVIRHLVEQVDASNGVVVGVVQQQNMTNEKMIACLQHNSDCIAKAAVSSESNTQMLEKVAVELRVCREQRMPRG